MPTSNKIRAARALIGWSQADLAKAAGVDPATIVKMESAGHSVAPGRSDVLQRVVTALSRAGARLTDTGVEFVKKPRA